MSPQSCTIYGSSSGTSSAGNAFAKVVTYSCPAATSGTTEWEDYNAANGLAFSGTGVHDCGHIYSLGSSYSVEYGSELTTGGTCYTQMSTDFSTNTLGSHAYPQVSGGTSTNETVWSSGSSSTKCDPVSPGCICLEYIQAYVP